MEAIKGGEVFDLIFETGKLQEPIARRLFLEMLVALQYIHSMGQAHRDLKLENILFRSNYKTVIIDMGFVIPL